MVNSSALNTVPLNASPVKTVGAALAANAVAHQKITPALTAKITFKATALAHATIVGSIYGPQKYFDTVSSAKSNVLLAALSTKIQLQATTSAPFALAPPVLGNFADLSATMSAPVSASASLTVSSGMRSAAI